MEQIATVQTQAPQQQSLRKMLGMGQPAGDAFAMIFQRSEEHTSELQSH